MKIVKNQLDRYIENKVKKILKEDGPGTKFAKLNALSNEIIKLANELKNSGTWGEAKRIASNIEGTAKQIRTL